MSTFIQTTLPLMLTKQRTVKELFIFFFFLSFSVNFKFLRDKKRKSCIILYLFGVSLFFFIRRCNDHTEGAEGHY